MHVSVFVWGLTKARHVALVKIGLFRMLKKSENVLIPLTLPLLVTSAEYKWNLMAFFEFLVRGADVSVFHGFQLCGPCSLEFLAGRSEALIYQDVLSVRCVRGKGNSDNSTRTPACSQLRGALTQV